ncbi:MAG: GNAT family N-acetyltransferase [Syntrophobacteraceae bacterium]
MTDIVGAPGLGMEEIKKAYPEKFSPERVIFEHIRAGAHIFVGTACGEPQYLLNALMGYVESHPHAFFDAELFHVTTLGVAPYDKAKYKPNFRSNSFFISDNTRRAINQGDADYTPLFMSQIPGMFYRGLAPVDVALIQTSLPDRYGLVNLGVSVDIVKPAIQQARLIIAQVNSHMPRVHGDGFIHIKDIDFIIPYDEPLLEYSAKVEGEVVQRIGQNVANLIQDGDTIQVGYGSIPDALLAHFKGKKHLGVHSEMISDGTIELIKSGVVDNSRKSINRGKSIASFCMGKKETFEYLNDNPTIELRTVDYTNNPLIIAQHSNMCAINSALEIDLTGQSTAESLGSTLYSGVGGQADFMRGTVLAPGGKCILVVQSTAKGGEVSRIVPFLKEGAGITLHRGDVHYVVTEYGIAYLHGKNIRERAMSLIAIAHPKFQPWLIQEAKRRHLIYSDQAFIPGKQGEYPKELETRRTTKGGVEMFMRPVRISDEPLLKEFFYSLSPQSMYRRFISTRRDMPHERLQEFVIINYAEEVSIQAIIQKDAKEEIVGIGRYYLNESTHTAEVAFAVKDAFQSRGIGSELLDYLIFLAKKRGLIGLEAELLTENRPMYHVFDKAGFKVIKTEENMYFMKLLF